MLVLVIVALISTGAFYRKAKSQGCHPGKIASLPFVGLGLLLMVDYLAFPLLEKFLQAVVSSAGIQSLISTGYNVLVILLYLAFVRHVWFDLNRSGATE